MCNITSSYIAHRETSPYTSLWLWFRAIHARKRRCKSLQLKKSQLYYICFADPVLHVCDACTPCTFARTMGRWPCGRLELAVQSCRALCRRLLHDGFTTSLPPLLSGLTIVIRGSGKGERTFLQIGPIYWRMGLDSVGNPWAHSVLG